MFTITETISEFKIRVFIYITLQMGTSHILLKICLGTYLGSNLSLKECKEGTHTYILYKSKARNSISAPSSIIKHINLNIATKAHVKRQSISTSLRKSYARYTNTDGKTLSPGLTSFRARLN